MEGEIKSQQDLPHAETWISWWEEIDAAMKLVNSLPFLPLLQQQPNWEGLEATGERA